MDQGWYTGLAVALILLLLRAVFRAIARRSQRKGPPVAPPVEVPDGFGLVTVRRPFTGLEGAAVPLQIVVDGAVRGKVKSGAAVSIPIEAGSHAISVAAGSKSSISFDFVTSPGGATEFETELVHRTFSAAVELRQVAPSQR